MANLSQSARKLFLIAAAYNNLHSVFREGFRCSKAQTCRSGRYSSGAIL
jgi:hypothetical protein